MTDKIILEKKKWTRRQIIKMGLLGAGMVIGGGGDNNTCR